MLFEVTPEELRKYEYVVTLEKSLDTAMRSGFRKTQCDQAIENLEESIQQNQVIIHRHQVLGTVTSIGLVIDYKNDPNNSIRRKLKQSSKMFSWDMQTFAEILCTCSLPLRNRDTNTTNSTYELTKMKVWLLSRLNEGDCNIIAKPMDPELQNLALSTQQSSMTCKLFRAFDNSNDRGIDWEARRLVQHMPTSSLNSVSRTEIVSTTIVFILPLESSVASVDYEKYCSMVVTGMASMFDQSTRYIFVIDIRDPAKLCQTFDGLVGMNFTVCSSLNAEKKCANCLILTSAT